MSNRGYFTVYYQSNWTPSSI